MREKKGNGKIGGRRRGKKEGEEMKEGKGE